MALGSVSKMVRKGNRSGVRCTLGSYIENKMTKDILWLRERSGSVRRGQKRKPSSGEAGHEAWPGKCK